MDKPRKPKDFGLIVILRNRAIKFEQKFAELHKIVV